MLPKHRTKLELQIPQKSALLLHQKRMTKIERIWKVWVTSMMCMAVMTVLPLICLGTKKWATRSMQKYQILKDIFEYVELPGS